MGTYKGGRRPKAAASLCRCSDLRPPHLFWWLFLCLCLYFPLFISSPITFFTWGRYFLWQRLHILTQFKKWVNKLEKLTPKSVSEKNEKIMARSKMVVICLVVDTSVFVAPDGLPDTTAFETAVETRGERLFFYFISISNTISHSHVPVDYLLFFLAA